VKVSEVLKVLWCLIQHQGLTADLRECYGRIDAEHERSHGKVRGRLCGWLAGLVDAMKSAHERCDWHPRLREPVSAWQGEGRQVGPVHHLGMSSHHSILSAICHWACWNCPMWLFGNEHDICVHGLLIVAAATFPASWWKQVPVACMSIRSIQPCTV